MSRKVIIDDSDVVIDSEENDTILEAAEKGGYSIPYSCRKGVCSTCLGTLVEGVVQDRSRSIEAPADSVYFCQAKPLTNVTIRPTDWAEYDPLSRKKLDAKIKKIKWLSEDVAEVTLKFPIGVRAIFRAGQYLNVLFEGNTRSYSMANPPHKNTEAVLHVRRYEGGVFSDVFLKNASVNDKIVVEVPFGDVQLDLDSSEPLIMLATGTGFAPVKSIVETLIHLNIDRPVHFFWGARQEADLYMIELAQSWEAKFEWFSFTPVLSRPEDDWTGETGWVQSAALSRFNNFDKCSVYACGGNEMVSASRDAFTDAGLDIGDFHCDSFVPALTVPLQA